MRPHLIRSEDWSDGAYRRLHERGELPWQESARPYVLDAIDRARDWSDLHQRLAAHGVVAKLVQRGERVRGLAFAEGFDRGAPGCAASRIDPCCALPALERRFGPLTPSREIAKETIDATRWVQSRRTTILAAVDGAKSWDELTERLDRDGIVVNLIQRGTRVQGLAFAQGRDPDAPGCSASRIHPRCKKAALEQRFGACPFQPQQRHEHRRSAVRDRAEHGEQATRAGCCAMRDGSLITLGCAPSTPRIAIASFAIASVSFQRSARHGGTRACAAAARCPAAARSAPAVARSGAAGHARCGGTSTRLLVDRRHDEPAPRT